MTLIINNCKNFWRGKKEESRHFLKKEVLFKIRECINAN